MYSSTNDLKQHYRLVLARNFDFQFNDGRGDSFSFLIRFNIENSPDRYPFGGYQIGKNYFRFSKKGRNIYNKINKLFEVKDIYSDLDQREMTDPLMLWALFPKDSLPVHDCPAVGFAKISWDWCDKKNAVNYILEGDFFSE